MAEENADIKYTEHRPSDSTMRKVAVGALLGSGLGSVVYIAGWVATGEVNPLEWGDNFDEWLQNIKIGDTTPESDPTAKEIAQVGEQIDKVTEDLQNLKEDVDKAQEAAATGKIPEETETTEVENDENNSDAASCAADETEEVTEKVCVGPEEKLIATADSSCDGIIALSREALWGNADFVTPEMVANIENPFVKAVYQALLDGDRSALTTALTNLYAENGAFNPENASGVLDGLKDSIIIYPGDQIVIDENGWTLVRKGGDEVALVDCEGKLFDVDEKMSDTGKCGDKIIPVSELPKEDVEPLCGTNTCEADRVADVSKAPTESPTEAEVRAKLSGLSPEEINAYDNSILSPELKERLIATNTAVLANLESDSTDGSIPFLVTDSGKATVEDFAAAARNGYYETNDGMYIFNVQEVGPDGLKQPYCIKVNRETFELLKSGAYGDGDSLRELTGRLAFETPGDSKLTVVTDTTESGVRLKTGDLTVLKNGEVARVLNVKDWEAAIQRDATFRNLKTT